MDKPEIITNTPAPISRRDSLIAELKALIIHALNLHHINPDQIKPETTFGSGGLNLDSVDILEVVVAVEQKYKIKVKDAEVGQRYFSSLTGIAEYIMGQSA